MFFDFLPFFLCLPFLFCSFSLFSSPFLPFPFLEDPRKGRQMCLPCSLLFPLLSTATCPPVCQHGKAAAEGCRCSTTSGYTTRLVRVFGRYKAAAKGKSLSALCAYRGESCVFGVNIKTVWSLCLDGKAALEPPTEPAASSDQTHGDSPLTDVCSVVPGRFLRGRKQMRLCFVPPVRSAWLAVLFLPRRQTHG